MSARPDAIAKRDLNFIENDPFLQNSYALKFIYDPIVVVKNFAIICLGNTLPINIPNKFENIMRIFAMSRFVAAINKYCTSRRIPIYAAKNHTV